MSNFEGIFKTKKGFFERVDGRYNKLNLTPKVYEKCSNGKYTYALNDNQKLCPITFENEWEKKNYIKQFSDLKTIYHFDEWIEYVNKNHWKKELPNPRVMFLDIETIDLNDRRFPQPHIASAPITHIQIMDSKTKKYDICGNICETGDRFAEQREITEIKEGDLLVIENAGAYCYSMGGVYNLRAMPAEVLVHNKQDKLVRRALSNEELVNKILEECN